jgi:hypothetical protein
MSKFGAIIEQAKSQNVGKPENKKTVNPKNSKAGKIENQKDSKQENQITGKPEYAVAEKLSDRGVNLSIKVPESRRRHWVSEAKRQGTSLTAVILESLSKRFGEPEQ